MQSESLNRQSIFPLLWIMLFDHVSLNITFPILTLLFFDVQSSLFTPDTSQAIRSMWYGLCVAVPHIGNIAMGPLLSTLSDELGRKKILLLSTLSALLFAITAGLGILWGILGLLFLGRIIQGVFSRTNPIAQAVIGDISSPRMKIRNMGYLQSAISVGAFIGPILGGYFAKGILFSELNFSLPYFIAALFAGISWVLTLFFFQETLVVKPAPLFWSQFNYKKIKNVVMKPVVLGVSAILFASQLSWSLYYQFIPPILKTVLHFDPHKLGIFVGMIALWLTLATSFGIQFLNNYFSLRKMLFFSLYLILIGLLLSVIFCVLPKEGYTFILIWAAAIPTAVGDVIAYSCLITFYSDAVKKEEQGKVMGICFVVIGFTWSLTGILGGLLMSVSPLLPLIVAPCGIILALILLYSRKSLI
jgi:MFS family permease